MDVAWVAEEMRGAQLADPRQSRSVQRITAALASHTQLSLTAACGPGLRQAAHRIFEHPETTVAGLLSGHFQATAARCAAEPLVLIAQDTTTFSYRQTQIEGLGRVNQYGRTGALLGHAALALTETGIPLGLLHLELWGATDGSAPCPQTGESGKWEAALTQVADQLPAHVAGVLIQDREADLFDFLAAERPPHLDLLVRATHNRRVTLRSTVAPLSTPPAPTTEDERLFAAVAQGKYLGELRVFVPCGAATPQQILPRQREAVLALRCATVILPQPRTATSAATSAATEVVLQVLLAEEVTPPAGAAPVSWTLLTTLPVPDWASACRVVGYYARRWLIERLHFTLKSGLRAERLQIDDAYSLRHCLALYYVVAWRLLYLTYLARHEPERPAVAVLAADELTVLAAATQRELPTLQAAIREIAALGGYQHYRTAGPPGVKSLWLGWQRLTGMVEGWRLAHQQQGLPLCDA